MLTPAPRCAYCGSEHLLSNGHAPNGKLRFRCKDCNKYGRQNPGSAAYDEKTKAVILAAYHERTSIRGLNRIFGVSRNTVAAWLKKASSLPFLAATLVPAQSDDVLELDELWSFVLRRKDKR